MSIGSRSNCSKPSWIVPWSQTSTCSANDRATRVARDPHGGCHRQDVGRALPAAGGQHTRALHRAGAPRSLCGVRLELLALSVYHSLCDGLCLLLIRLYPLL